LRPHTIAVLFITLAGFALRLRYLTTTHPFFDEYTTVLAARQILRQGLPILPSGLFYEHGLLSTYLIAPFTALFINAPLAHWQPAHWGLMLPRWPGLLISTATIPLVYAAALTIYNLRFTIYDLHPSKIVNSIAVLAAGLFALSPEGMVWGGRARMYALAVFLVLLTVYWAFRGAVYPAPAKYRWLALAALFATLFTQFGALMFVPPLVAAMVIIGWLSYKTQRSAFRLPPSFRPWFFRKTALPEGFVLAIITGLAILLKRLGQPLGSPLLTDSSAGNFVTELAGTISYQTTFYFTWNDTLKFLGRQFGVTHHFWLSMVTVTGLTVAVAVFAAGRNRAKPKLPNLPLSPGNLFLVIIFGLIIFEMVTLLRPFRRNPRYVVMYLPLFYLIAANAVVYLLSGAKYLWQKKISKINTPHPSGTSRILENRGESPRPPLRFFNFWETPPASSPGLLTALAALLLLALPGFTDLQIALKTPEPAYEEAMAKIYSNWQPGDTLLTINTPAAGLYLGGADGFTVQNEARQFLLNPDTLPVDRWLGAPWLGTAAEFRAALNAGSRVWFVTDTIRQPVYFGGDWQAVVSSQMEQVWAGDNALVYRTRADRVPPATKPDSAVNAQLGDKIQLTGYSLDRTTPSALTVTLFWQPLDKLPIDYTTFLHLRNSQGATVAQQDSQPLDGAYPTSRWQPGEQVIDPLTLPLPKNLPAGTYTLFTGMYRLDTLERLPVSNDTSGENAVLLGKVTIE